MSDNEKDTKTLSLTINAVTNIIHRKPRRRAPSAKASARYDAALIGWGLFSVGSCAVQTTGRMASNIKAEMAEADRMLAEAEARKLKEAEADEGQPSNAVVIAGARQAIIERAVDPDSVRFRNMGVYRQASGIKAVCGEFNSRNRIGGYNGFQRFVSGGIAKYTWVEAEVAGFDEAWETHCVNAAPSGHVAEAAPAPLN